MSRKPAPSPWLIWIKSFLQSRHMVLLSLFLFFSVGGFVVRGLLLGTSGVNIFPVHQVVVTGAHSLDRSKLKRLISPLTKKGFFAVSQTEVRATVRAMPWVRDVMVRRVWPDKIVVDIQEKIPVAHWNNKSLLSMAGDVFTPKYADDYFELPSFFGPKGVQMQMYSCYQNINNVLLPLKTEIASLRLSPLQSWEIVLKNGIEIRLGSLDILTHLSHFVKVYPSVVGKRVMDVEYVDLRYEDGFALRWKNKRRS